MPTSMVRMCWAYAVVFYPNATGTVTAVVYEMEDLDHVGESGMLATPQGKLLTCTDEAVARQACAPEQLGMYLVDKAGAGHTLQQQRFRFGTGTGNRTVMVRTWR